MKNLKTGKNNAITNNTTKKMKSNLTIKIQPPFIFKNYYPDILAPPTFLIFDILLTISCVNRAHKSDMKIPPNNSYERFLDKTFNSKYLKNMFNNNWK